MITRQGHSIKVLAAVAATMLLVAGCRGSAGVAPPESPASVAPQATMASPAPVHLVPAAAPADPSECIYATHDVEPVPAALDSLASVSSVVAQATVNGKAGDAMWNTPGGKRPKVGDLGDGSAELFTPWTVTVTDELRGTQTLTRVMVPGGTNGCDTEVYSNQALPTFADGEAFTLFLSPVTLTDGTATDDVFVLRAWKAAADGTFTDESGATLTKAQLKETLAAHPQR